MRFRLRTWSLVWFCCLAGSASAALAATGTVALRWTSPGDDGYSGRATAYDIRYSETPITETNFELAMPVAGVPSPQPAGQLEFFRMSNFVVGRGYYFALKSLDEAQNWSPISNVGYYVIGATAGVVTPPSLSLSPPWPNPARGAVRWSYALPQAGPIQIDAFAVTGARVRSVVRAWKDAGPGEATWNLRDDRGRPIASGIYTIRATLGGKTLVNRLVVIR